MENNEEEEIIKKKSKVVKILSFVIPVLIILLGFGIFRYLLSTKPVPKETEKPKLVKTVKFFNVKPFSYQLSVSGYGNSKASEEWNPVAEVPGKVIYIHPDFERGEFIPSGTVIAKIDPTDYEIAVRRNELDIQDKMNSLQEIQQNKKNLQNILSLRKDQIQISQKTLNRQKNLLEQGASTEESLNQVEDNYINRLISIQDIENQLKLIPVQIQKMETALELSKTRLQEAKRNLEKTVIRLPFSSRCVSKSISINQFVGTGGRIGTFYSFDKVKVEALFETHKLTQFLNKSGEAENISSNLERLLNTINTEILWKSNEKSFNWKGKVTGFASNLDLNTQTIPVIVEVINPTKKLIPLLPDTFCQVKLLGPVLKNAIVIPRDLVHNNKVYVIDNNVLKFRNVDAISFEENNVIIDSGIKEGDKIIITDIFPAIEGIEVKGDETQNPTIINSQNIVSFKENPKLSLKSKGSDS